MDLASPSTLTAYRPSPRAASLHTQKSQSTVTEGRQSSKGPGFSFSCRGVSFIMNCKQASFVVEIMLCLLKDRIRYCPTQGIKYLWLYKQTSNKMWVGVWSALQRNKYRVSRVYTRSVDLRGPHATSYADGFPLRCMGWGDCNRGYLRVLASKCCYYTEVLSVISS